MLHESRFNSIRVYHGRAFPKRALIEQIQGLEPILVESPADIENGRAGILLLDCELYDRHPQISNWKAGADGWLLIIARETVKMADFLVPVNWPDPFVLKALEGSVRELNLKFSKQALTAELAAEHEKLFQLTHIGLALSAERDLNRLLTKILSEGRNWACCDAASLFLVEKEDDKTPQLVFKLTQNDSVHFPFKEQKFTLDKQSIAGFVAVTGDLINLDDVYKIQKPMPFDFNSTFDETINYRTRSMLTIPMKNHNQEVIGVLQFINRKTSSDIRLTTREITEKYTLSFSEDITELLQALASQAAVAIGNTILLSRIQQLFEGFVTAAVTAIEQRDPTTSGHSFRVAEFTTELAKAIPRSGIAKFKSTRFDSKQIKEIRYASLLHDFGKVGVREPVLIKRKKLAENGLSIIWHRFALFKEKLRSKSLQNQLDYLFRNGREAFSRFAPEVEKQLEEELARFTRFYDEIAAANEPSILPEGRFSHLEEIRDMKPFEIEERNIRLLENEEFLALSVRKGTLTPEERKEIESHVIHTFNFLKQIPWTHELSRIPDYAVAHHEKLDGSGYPTGMTGKHIPLPSKMMTVADIYDALTASDRPYKKSMPPDRALRILETEADQGFLDRDLVGIFIEAEIYKIKSQHKAALLAYPGYNARFYKRSVCNYDLLTDI